MTRSARLTVPARALLTLVLVLGVLLATLQPAEASVRFDDVPGSDVFSADIDWLASRGVTAGCNPPANTRFCPDAAVTRGQMAAFLVRALDLPAGDESFDDTAGSVFERDIAALAEAGITKGCNPPDNDLFCPTQTVTRGQMAAFVHRALPDLPGTVRTGAKPLGGTDSTFQPSISDDGRFVAHTAWVDDTSVIRVVDRSAGTHRDLRPGPSDTWYQQPMLSGDGEWILVKVGTDDSSELWLVPRAGGVHHVIDDDAEYGGTEDDRDIDRTGRYVVFGTSNPDLVTVPDTKQLLRWDRVSGEYENVGVDASGANPTYGAIAWGRISDDGSKVLFEANQPNITADTPWYPAPAPTYLYLRDVTAGVTELVSRDAHGDPVGGVMYSTLSGDGTTVAYQVYGGDLTVRSLGTGALRTVPMPADAPYANRTTLSADGAVLAWFATRNEITQIYAWDSSTIRLLSRSSTGEPADGAVLANTFFPGRPALSGSGQWAAFASTAGNLGAPAQTPGEIAAANVFVAEAAAP